MKRFNSLLGVAIVFTLSALVFAAVPKLINFQGILKDGSGNPVSNGSYSVTFRIYDAAAGGNNLWTETQSVTTSSGLFSVLLGAATPVPDSAFQDTTRYLGIKVGTDPEMTPRQQLVSVAYGFRIGSVDGASGGTITSKVSIGPGHTNTGANAFVAGEGNTASGNWSTVGGGISNTANNTVATVGGGNINTASGANATVSGGAVNIASGPQATVGGGLGNTASNDMATVGGGQNDTANGSHSTVGGGFHNVASGDSSVVSGGSSNRASGQFATVGGGVQNTVSGGASVIGGGQANNASGGTATIGGGTSNAASADYATIGGGIGNRAIQFVATVGGGRNNNASYIGATVGGGFFNTASGSFFGGATVGGGESNVASADNATVGGGRQNTASGTGATVGGGRQNTASGTDPTVGGGGSNTASAQNATVGGGGGNAASNVFATVGGGENDTASANHATVPGGFRNLASGSSSFAAGAQAKALHSGTFVWSNGFGGFPFSSTGVNQFLISAPGGVGIGTASPQGVLHLLSPANPTVMRIQSSGTPGFGRIEFVSDPQGSAFEWRPGYIQSTDNGGFTGGLAFFVNGSGPLFGSVEVMRAVNGRLGIGTTAPAALLHVNGTAGNGTGVWSTVSDRRLKRDIEPIQNALETLNQLQPVSFRWKDAKKDAEYGRVRGLIAQDVEKILPEWVKTDPDGYKRLEPIGIDALLIEAIKELKAENVELKKRISELEKSKPQARVETDQEGDSK